MVVLHLARVSRHPSPAIHAPKNGRGRDYHHTLPRGPRFIQRIVHSQLDVQVSLHPKIEFFCTTIQLPKTGTLPKAPLTPLPSLLVSFKPSFTPTLDISCVPVCPFARPRLTLCHHAVRHKSPPRPKIRAPRLSVQSRHVVLNKHRGTT